MLQMCDAEQGKGQVISVSDCAMHSMLRILSYWSELRSYPMPAGFLPCQFQSHKEGL